MKVTFIESENTKSLRSNAYRYLLKKYLTEKTYDTRGGERNDNRNILQSINGGASKQRL